MAHRVLLPFLVVAMLLPAPVTMALDLPQATALSLAGTGFDDRPVTFPVTDSFQRAMHAVASDLGKHCAATEAYGWRLQQTEQNRVNTIFNEVAGKLSTAGYTLTPQTPPSATREITIFTAQKPGTDLLFMWSAGELGLVLLVCDIQNGIVPAATTTAIRPAPAVVTPPVAETAPPKVKPQAKKPQAKPKPKKTAAKPATQTTIETADLPPVVPEKSNAQAIVNMPSVKKGSKAAPLSPEVKAMLDSLPEAPPAATPQAAPAPVAAPPEAAIPPTVTPEPENLAPLSPHTRDPVPVPLGTAPMPTATPPASPQQ